MKVIILNGSPKAEGNTATALHEVERTLNQQGIETEWIHWGIGRYTAVLRVINAGTQTNVVSTTLLMRFQRKWMLPTVSLSVLPCISLRHQAPYSHFSTVSSTPLFTRTG